MVSGLQGKCDQAERLGGFEATVKADYSSVKGAVADGVLPGSVTTNAFEEGDCTLWLTHVLFCDPPCSGNETCDFDGSCVSFPLGQNLGTVVIEGLNKEIEMKPREPRNNYFDADVPHPVFNMDNEAITLSTEEGYIGAITLRGAGSKIIQPAQGDWIITWRRFYRQVGCSQFSNPC